MRNDQVQPEIESIFCAVVSCRSESGTSSRHFGNVRQRRSSASTRRKLSNLRFDWNNVARFLAEFAGTTRPILPEVLTSVTFTRGTRKQKQKKRESRPRKKNHNLLFLHAQTIKRRRQPASNVPTSIHVVRLLGLLGSSRRIPFSSRFTRSFILLPTGARVASNASLVTRTNLSASESGLVFPCARARRFMFLWETCRCGGGFDLLLRGVWEEGRDGCVMRSGGGIRADGKS